MNVSLTPQLEKYVGDKVKSGKYQTASEVVREALRLLQERDTRIEDLKDKIQVGIDQLDRGEYSDLTPQEILREARKLAKPRASITRGSRNKVG